MEIFAPKKRFLEDRDFILMNSHPQNLCEQFNGFKNGYRVFSNYAEIKKERFAFNLNFCQTLIFVRRENPWRRPGSRRGKPDIGRAMRAGLFHFCQISLNWLAETLLNWQAETSLNWLALNQQAESFVHCKYGRL